MQSEMTFLSKISKLRFVLFIVGRMDNGPAEIQEITFE